MIKNIAAHLLRASVLGFASGVLATIIELMAVPLDHHKSVTLSGSFSLLGWNSLNYFVVCFIIAIALMSTCLLMFSRNMDRLLKYFRLIALLSASITLSVLFIPGMILKNYWIEAKMSFFEKTIIPYALIVLFLVIAISFSIFIMLQKATKKRHFMLVVSAMAGIGIMAVPISGIDDYLNFFLRGRSSGITRIADQDYPNIILVVIDTLRADRLGLNGSSLHLTPNLDTFSRKSTNFTSAFAQAPWTVPSMGSMLTGLEVNEHGVFKNVKLSPDKIPFFTELLKNHGYTTAGIVGNYVLSSYWGWNSLFDQYYCLAEKSWLAAHANCYINSYFRIIDYLFGNQGCDASLVTDKAIEWLEEDRKSPFFLWVHYIDPHQPYGFGYNPTPNYDGRFQGVFSSPPGLVNEGELQLTAEEKRHIASLYNFDVQFLDFHLGRLLRHMERSGLMENSIVVITSDHGEEFWEHGKFEHGHSFHREVLRVPLILRGDRWPADKIIRSQVRLLDIAPTLYELTGIPAPPMVSGISLLAALNGNDSGRPVLSAKNIYGEKSASLRADHVLTIHGLESNYVEVFDLLTDPGETKDIAGSNESLIKKRAAIVLKMMENQKQKRLEILGAEGHEELSPDDAILDQIRALGYVQ